MPHVSKAAKVAAAGLLGLVILGCGDDSTKPKPTPVEVTAALTVSPASGTVLTDFDFDASASSAEGAAIEFRWDWESDGTWDTDWSSDATGSHRYPAGGVVTATVAARSGSASDSASASLTLDTRRGEHLESLALPSLTVSGLTWDGADFWITGWSGDIYKIDGESGAVADTIPGLSAWTGGIAWDGVHLWAVDYVGGSKLFERDPVSGETVSSFPITYSAGPGGVAWDGEYFYVGSDKGDSDGDGLIHKYLPNGAEVGAIPAPRGSENPRGLAFDGENLWVAVADIDTLYAVDPADGALRWTIRTQGVPGDVTVRGDYLWAVLGGPKLQRIVP